VSVFAITGLRSLGQSCFGVPDHGIESEKDMFLIFSLRLRTAFILSSMLLSSK
jgi:hypothetical protein